MIHRYILLLLTMMLCGFTHAAKILTQSPDGGLAVTFQINKGIPYYKVSWQKEEVLSLSRMGYVLADGALDQDFKVVGVKRNSHDTKWHELYGEEDSVRSHYNETTIMLQQTRGLKRKLNIVFRVFNDGIGFRYVIPEQSGLHKIAISEEQTQFNLSHDAPAWSISLNHIEYYEGKYEKSLISQKDTVCTPLTIEYSPRLYMAIHEAALEDYATLNLTPRGNQLVAALTPWSDGMKVYGENRLQSPWRTIIFSPTAAGLITNRVMLNLNEPCKIEDTSWIEPGRYIGIWWSIHQKKNTWEMGPHHGATTENVKRYIDFAAKHGFSGVLSEGWNPGWGKGEKVTYLKSYPDFDIEEVNRYAQQKGVRWIGHMESWGQGKLIEKEMEQAFAWYHSMGVNAVKTGYVGRLMDGVEKPSSQYGIRHYRKVIECAAKHQIMIDNHEPAMPTGICRTYPNLMTQEGVRGQEYNAWDVKGGNLPEHTVTIPFTRCLAGPIDFTPAIFNFSEIVKGTHPHSTLAKQLAEFVVLYSPLQMAADAIENYEGQPALTFIESCPTTWSKTIIPHGEIGQYITVCRKERGGNRWFVGSMTNADSRSLDVKLDFLDKGKVYRAVIYEDGADADFETNPYPMHIRQIEVKADDTLHLKLARSGGAAIRIEEI